MFERVLQSAVGLFIWGLFLFAGAVTIVFAVFDFLSVARMAAVLEAPGLVAPGGFPATARAHGALGTSILVGIFIKAAIKLVVGLALLAVGAIGMGKRLRGVGSNGPAVRVATSPTGRWAAICTFTFGIGVALYGVPEHLHALADSGAHALIGVRTEGLVEDRREITDPVTGDVRAVLLDVSFSPNQRRLWMKTLKVAERDADDLEPGQEVALVHPIFDPQDVRLAETLKSPLAALWPFLWRAGFIFVGVRGIQRNWPGAGPSGPERGSLETGLSSLPGARRTGFGRRGAGR
jgi:hypothetical protein